LQSLREIRGERRRIFNVREQQTAVWREDRRQECRQRIGTVNYDGNIPACSRDNSGDTILIFMTRV